MAKQSWDIKLNPSYACLKELVDTQDTKNSLPRNRGSFKDFPFERKSEGNFSEPDNMFRLPTFICAVFYFLGPSSETTTTQSKA